jgi:hypothetical protein
MTSESLRNRHLDSGGNSMELSCRSLVITETDRST